MAKPSQEPVLVSIVLPTYNRAHLLSDAIHSCLSQTWSHLELIIVDDGSKDNTEDVVRQWIARDPRVRYIKQANGKIPKALNTGFYAARGDYFTWTSDDNLYEPEALAVMVSYLQEHPETGLVYCNMKIIDEHTNVIAMAFQRPPSDLLLENTVGGCFMYRRSVAEAVGDYDKEMFLAEDYDYWLRISRVASVAHLADSAPYLYRDHPASLTSTRRAEVELQAATVRIKYARNEREKRAWIADGYCKAGHALRKIHQFDKAMSYYLQALRMSPFFGAAYRGIAATCVRHTPRLAVNKPPSD